MSIQIIIVNLNNLFLFAIYGFMNLSLVFGNNNQYAHTAYFRMLTLKTSSSRIIQCQTI